MTDLNSTPSALRFAVLRHEGIDDPHFDLLVETHPGSDLATWRSPIWPIVEPVNVIRLKDHRRIYLNYEGDLTGNRGAVLRIADGNCELHIGENGIWTIRLPGIVLKLNLVNGANWHACSLIDASSNFSGTGPK